MIDMILNKQDLKNYIKADMEFYYKQSRWDRFIYRITEDPVSLIARYLRYMRKEEYYFNSGKGKWGKVCYLFYFRKKNHLGNRLGFKIPKNTFGPGLTIFHHGEIIVNESAKVGANCRLHGGNCIGNDGIRDCSPYIGDNLDLGIGAKIIGDVHLGNFVRIGANAVVTKSFEEDSITLVGIPARKI